MADTPAPPPTLAVAMIVRNAAAELPAALQSVAPVADEIVVLDTGSTDDTPQVAQQLGISLHRRPWTDSFAVARNACLDAVKSDWVLWLDAGEHLPEASHEALRLAMANDLQPERAYLLPIQLPAAPGQIGGEQLYQIRLHPRSAALRFAGRIRERLDDSVMAAGLSLEPREIPILRSVGDHDPDVRTARAHRNVRLADLAIAESGPTAELQNCLGEALQILGDPLRAAHHYQQALKLASPKSPDELEAYYGLLTCMNGASTGRQAHLALCMQAIERFPLDAQLLVALGGYLQACEQLPLAVRAYDMAFRHGQTELRLWHLPEIREIAASCAATAYLLLGDMDQAQTLLEAAIRTFPQSARLAKQIAQLSTQKGRRAVA